MNVKNIETKKDAIQALKDFYISMYKQEKILLSKMYNDPIYINNAISEKELSEKLDTILNKEDNEDKRIEILKKLIEDIGEYLEETEIKEKLNTIGKEYYDNLLEKVERARGLTDLEIILDIIEQSNAKIHEDRSEKEEYQYGDLSKINNGNIKINEYSYEHNKKRYNLYPIEIYETYKIKKNEEKESKVISKVGKQYLTKFRIEVEYKQGKMASMEFFGDIDLERNLEKNGNEYFLPTIAAILQAKREGNQYIGQINCIYKDNENGISTFVRTKDENLENSVKKLVEKELKEQQENEKAKPKEEKEIKPEEDNQK